MSTTAEVEEDRVARLLDAQAKAAELFAAVETGGIIVAGVRESAASNAIRDLAARQLGVRRHWHKRIVRAGPNTLQAYRYNPPDRVIEADDIVFCDFGPIFEDWEADFGRTYVLGDDPVKHRLAADLPGAVRRRPRLLRRPSRYHRRAVVPSRRRPCRTAGWEWGGTIAGHLVGEFPHEENDGGDVQSRVAPGSDRPMRGFDRVGRVCHWILEIHLVDRARQIGGFHEELLDLGPRPLPRRRRQRPL